MDKTISISLGGFSFIVDDRAFMKLKNYLDEIRRSLHGMEGTEDIIADVETRIAELFKERLGSREVVNESDVDHIIDIMGRPEQYMDEDDAAESKSARTYSGSSSRSSTASEGVKKKLYRDPNDKIIAGVLSGLAHYFGIETWITRVLWIVLFFADIPLTGTMFTILSYIILWIILPKAETATQKYEMYGQAGDFETIKKNASQAAAEMKGVARDASGALGKIFHVLGKIILFFIGFMLICSGIGLIIGAISLLVTTFTGMPVEIFGYFFDYEWQNVLAKTLLMILMIIPAILTMALGARLISKRVKISKMFVFSSLIIWVLAIIAATIMGVSFGKNFMHDIEYTDKKSFAIAQDTITINFNEFKSSGKYKYKWFDNDMGDFIQFEGSLHRRIENDIHVEETTDSVVSVEIQYHSKGRNMDNARENAEQIQYNYSMNAQGELEFNDYIILPEGSKFRDQYVEIYIYVPKGKTIHTKNVDDVEYNGENDYYNSYSGKNKFIKFVDGELKCLNCEGDKFDNDEDENKEYHINLDSGNSTIKVSREGVKIEDGEDKIIIDNKKIKATDGTDSINIDLSDN